MENQQNDAPSGSYSEMNFSSEQKNGLKRKHVKLTISNKLKVIQELEKGVSGEAISELFGISIQTVWDIKKQTPVIKQYVDRFESALFCWYLEQKRSFMTVRMPDLKAAADKLKKNYHISGLNCDTAWLSAFRNRYSRMANDKNLNELSPNQPTTSSQHSLPSSTLQENVESNEREAKEASLSNPPVDVIIKEEDEILEYDDPSEDNGQDIKESVSKETMVLDSAKKGIDAVINYVGYSSDRWLWGYYRELRIIREKIIEEQKKMHGNDVQGTNPEFDFPNV